MDTPEQLGRYALQRRLGAGGMAEVFLAEFSGPGGFVRQVALKRVLPHLSTQEEFIQAFISEARLGGQLNHVNIVQTIELGQEGDYFYLAMEYVDGPTLHQLLRFCRQKQRPLPIPLGVEIGRQLAEGLAYAHEARDLRGAPLNMIHRDLKPANILISRHGNVKITDFGVAKAESNLQQTTLAGSVKGTVAFMSPEQARGEVLDPRSDLYSLGAMLFEIFALEPLYPKAVSHVHLPIVQAGDVTERLLLLEALPSPLRKLITQLLAPSPEGRPGSARQVARALEQLRGRLTPCNEHIQDILLEVQEDLASARLAWSLELGLIDAPPGPANGPEAQPNLRSATLALPDLPDEKTRVTPEVALSASGAPSAPRRPPSEVASNALDSDLTQISDRHGLRRGATPAQAGRPASGSRDQASSGHSAAPSKVIPDPPHAAGASGQGGTRPPARAVVRLGAEDSGAGTGGSSRPWADHTWRALDTSTSPETLPAAAPETAALRDMHPSATQLSGGGPALPAARAKAPPAETRVSLPLLAGMFGALVLLALFLGVDWGSPGKPDTALTAVGSAELSTAAEVNPAGSGPGQAQADAELASGELPRGSKVDASLELSEKSAASQPNGRSPAEVHSDPAGSDEDRTRAKEAGDGSGTFSSAKARPELIRPAPAAPAKDPPRAAGAAESSSLAKPDPDPGKARAPQGCAALIGKAAVNAGSLAVNSSPFAYVIIGDCRFPIQTPLMPGSDDARVAAGTHELIFRTEDGREQRRTVTISPGQTSRLAGVTFELP